MPRSKLRSSMSVDEVDSVQAVREKVDIETVTVNNRLIKRPKFMREQISPRFRAVGSIETDEVEYDTHVKWVVSRPYDTWAYVCGVPNYADVMHSIITDGDYYVAAGWVRNGYGAIMKFDENANMLWLKTYAQAGFVKFIRMTNAGEYVIVGESTAWSNRPDYYDTVLVKTDKDGNIIWAKNIGTDDNDRPFGMCITPADEIVITVTGSGSTRIIKTDSNGNVLWVKKYSAGSYTYVRGVVALDNGDLVVAAHQGLSTPSYYFLLRLDPNGNIKWQKTYVFAEGGYNYTWRYQNVALTPDGKIVAVGHTKYLGSNMDAFVMCVDPDTGDVEWARLIEPQNDSTYMSIWTVRVTDSGDIYLVTNDNKIVKFDSNGNLQWAKGYGGGVSIKDLTLDTNKFYLYAVGDTWTYNFNSNYDIMMYKIAPTGDLKGEVIESYDWPITVVDATNIVQISDASLVVSDVTLTRDQDKTNEITSPSVTLQKQKL